MKLDGISAAISPPIPQPKTTPKPPESEPEVTVEEDGGGKANGVVSKLNEGGHFNAVADVRLRIVHFDNADLEQIDPALLPDPEGVPGKAYEKFLEQYRALYNASQAPAVPDEPPTDEPPPIDEEPVVEEPPADTPTDEQPVAEEPVIEDPVAEEPPATEEPPAAEVPVSDVPEPVSILLPPIEIEPAAPTPEETPVDESTGALTAFEEFLQTQVSQENPGALDIVI